MQTHCKFEFLNCFNVDLYHTCKVYFMAMVSFVFSSWIMEFLNIIQCTVSFCLQKLTYSYWFSFLGKRMTTLATQYLQSIGSNIIPFINLVSNLVYLVKLVHTWRKLIRILVYASHSWSVFIVRLTLTDT